MGAGPRFVDLISMLRGGHRRFMPGILACDELKQVSAGGGRVKPVIGPWTKEELAVATDLYYVDVRKY
jgi:hypothetical protein